MILNQCITKHSASSSNKEEAFCLGTGRGSVLYTKARASLYQFIITGCLFGVLCSTHFNEVHQIYYHRDTGNTAPVSRQLKSQTLSSEANNPSSYLEQSLRASFQTSHTYQSSFTCLCMMDMLGFGWLSIPYRLSTKNPEYEIILVKV